MAPELAALLLLVPTTSCSALLDFSDHAIPRDARADAPYTQAECAYQEPDDSFATAAAITPADTGPAAICAGDTPDHDFYRFTVPAMTSGVEIRISTVHQLGDLDLRLYDISGTAVLARSNGFDDDEAITCPGTAPMCPILAAGDYVFEVYPAMTGAANRYTFAITLSH